MASNCKTYSLLATLFLILAIYVNRSASRKLPRASSMSERYEQWIAKHAIVYEDVGEKVRRFEIFKDNVKFIDSFNAAGKKSYKLRVNKFADLTNEEFKLRSSGFKRNKKGSNSRIHKGFMYGNETKVPISVDWRKKGAVTHVKDQGGCGGCWAFSVVAATEGITKIKTGKLIALSEQQLIDCDEKDSGCQGGAMELAFNFIKKNQGLTTEANYPYNGKDGSCKSKKKITNGLIGYGIVPRNNESELLKATAKQPVSVAIEASGLSFQFYSGGVFTGDCGTLVDHGVTIVGYGVTSGGKKYWIVKNSWGKDWGEEGYVRIARDVGDQEGLCGIAMDCSFPIV